MTSRYQAFTVALENDVREDDAENLITAIRALRGVLTVVPVVSDISGYGAYERARRELQTKIDKALRED